MIKLGRTLSFTDLVKMMRVKLFNGQTDAERKLKKREIALAMGFEVCSLFIEPCNKENLPSNILIWSDTHQEAINPKILNIDTGDTIQLKL